MSVCHDSPDNNRSECAASALPDRARCSRRLLPDRVPGPPAMETASSLMCSGAGEIHKERADGLSGNSGRQFSTQSQRGREDADILGQNPEN